MCIFGKNPQTLDQKYLKFGHSQCQYLENKAVKLEKELMHVVILSLVWNECECIGENNLNKFY